MAWDDNWLRNDPTMIRGTNYGLNTTNFSGGGESSLIRGDELAQLNLSKLQNKVGSNYYTGGGDASGLPSWMTGDTMTGFGDVMKGFGSLASGWAAMKNLKLTRQAMENQQNQWQQNYESQRLTTNNAIANQNAWKQAQGRTDFGAYVGGKPPGTNYVG
jgi:hypothetical protein